MGDLVFFHPDGTAEIIVANKEPHVVEEIIIYCDLCNEPIAITPAHNDEVYLRCMKCDAVNGKPEPQV